MIHRHRGRLRDDATAPNYCTGIQGDSNIRNDISHKRSGCSEGGGATNLPKHVVSWIGTGNYNARRASGDERARHFEYDVLIAAGEVESESSIIGNIQWTGRHSKHCIGASGTEN
jgi:hypothetical protein